MKRIYYAVYSLRAKNGAGFGRDTFSADKPIDTMDRIMHVEAVLLKSAQERRPSEGIENLFLISWTELTGEP